MISKESADALGIAAKLDTHEHGYLQGFLGYEKHNAPRWETPFEGFDYHVLSHEECNFWQTYSNFRALCTFFFGQSKILYCLWWSPILFRALGAAFSTSRVMKDLPMFIGYAVVSTTIQYLMEKSIRLKHLDNAWQLGPFSLEAQSWQSHVSIPTLQKLSSWIYKVQVVCGVLCLILFSFEVLYIRVKSDLFEQSRCGGFTNVSGCVASYSLVVVWCSFACLQLFTFVVYTNVIWYVHSQTTYMAPIMLEKGVEELVSWHNAVCRTLKETNGGIGNIHSAIVLICVAGIYVNVLDLMGIWHLTSTNRTPIVFLAGCFISVMYILGFLAHCNWRIRKVPKLVSESEALNVARRQAAFHTLEANLQCLTIMGVPVDWSCLTQGVLVIVGGLLIFFAIMLRNRSQA